MIKQFNLTLDKYSTTPRHTDLMTGYGANHRLVLCRSFVVDVLPSLQGTLVDYTKVPPRIQLTLSTEPPGVQVVLWLSELHEGYVHNANPPVPPLSNPIVYCFNPNNCPLADIYLASTCGDGWHWGDTYPQMQIELRDAFSEVLVAAPNHMLSVWATIKEQ